MKTSLRFTGVFMAILIVMLPVCFADELNLVYDENGNFLSGDNSGLEREYNGLNQLVRIRNSTSRTVIQEFVHDPLEERIVIKKTYNNDGTLKETVYYFSKEWIRTVNSSGTFDTEFVYMNGQMVAEVNQVDGTKKYSHTDHLGSTAALTNSSGDVLQQTIYSPMGEIVSGGTETRYNYESKEYDSVADDTDFHFRKYKPEWGIFLQPDSLIQNVYDPQSLNRYMFERGNPYKYTDPDGHVLPLLAAIGIGIGVGIAVSAVWQLATKPTSEFSYGRTIVGGVAGGVASLFLAPLAIGSTVAAAAGAGIGAEILIEIGVGAGLSVIGEMDADEQERIDKENEEKRKNPFIPDNKGQGTQVPSYAQSNKITGNYFRNSYNSANQQLHYTQSINNLISSMRSSGSSEAVFGCGGGSGYVPGMGYVTDDGRTYPTSNPDWSPTPGVPRYGDDD